MDDYLSTTIKFIRLASKRTEKIGSNGVTQMRLLEIILATYEYVGGCAGKARW